MSNQLPSILKRFYSRFVPSKKFVYVSSSNNVYTNLALEDWIFRNMNFTDQTLLLMWRNDPCVLLGTFQNPWLETDPVILPNIGNGVSLARRRSGGGAVFHDRGNLNLTFFTTVKNYNKKLNLNFIQRVLKKFNIQIDINSRSDLVLNGAKISGSAAKIGVTNAYHHCSLLIDVDKTILKTALESSNLDIKTNATRSTTSDIINIRDKNPSITVTKLINGFTEEYLSSHEDFKLVYPEESVYKGFDNLRNIFSSWDWLYGRCPKFSVSFRKINFVVEKGIIKEVSSEGRTFFQELIGQKFDHNVSFLFKSDSNNDNNFWTYNKIRAGT